MGALWGTFGKGCLPNLPHMAAMGDIWQIRAGCPPQPARTSSVRTYACACSACVCTEWPDMGTAGRLPSRRKSSMPTSSVRFMRLFLPESHKPYGTQPICVRFVRVAGGNGIRVPSQWVCASSLVSLKVANIEYQFSGLAVCCLSVPTSALSVPWHALIVPSWEGTGRFGTLRGSFASQIIQSPPGLGR